ncbi:hypothetical protein Peur_063916 [Populus x canadensis]
MDKTPSNSRDDVEVRKGPWTLEEDLILTNHIANHGEGVWNSLAKAADCSISEHDEKDADSNVAGWSKIAKHLPGRTDNEIKNYWRTRIQKHIKQAETFAAPSSDETNEHGSSSSQVSSTTEFMVSNCLPSYQGDVEAFSGGNIPQELNENYWSMEDLWSMQLLNGD